MKKNLKVLSIIIWLMIIFYFSNQNADISSGVSSGILYNILSFFNIDNNTINNSVEIIGGPFRKLAHFSEYAILSFLVMNYIVEFKINIKKCLKYTLIFCLLAATFDEMHQYFIPGRAMTIIDVCIDTFGAFSMELLYIHLNKNKFLNENIGK